MDKVLCTKHGAPCMMKTGTKPGPNLGKCFYMCSVLRDKCDFVQQAKAMTSSACLKHPENIADLQYITIGKVSGEKRHYYKCSKGVEKGQNWCGYAVIEKVGKVVPLGDSHKQNTCSTTVTIGPEGAVKQSVATAEGNSSSSKNKPSGKRLSDYCLSSTLEKNIEKSDQNATGRCEQVDGSPDVLSNSRNINTSSGPGVTTPEVITIIDEDSNDFQTLANRIRNKSGISPEEIGITKSFANGARPKMASPLNGSHGSTAHGSKSFTSYRDINLCSEDSTNSLRDKITRELKQKKQIMGTVSLSSLPDNGERLRQDVVGLENQLSQLNIQLMNNLPAAQSVQASHILSENGNALVPPPAPPMAMTSTQQSQSVSKASAEGQFNLQEDIASRERISKELKEIKKVIRAVVLSSLPDKGEKLKKQATDLEHQLSYLNKKLINNGHSKPSGSHQNSKSYSQQPNSAKQSRPLAPKPQPPQVYTVYPNAPGASGKPQTIHVRHQPTTASGQQPGAMKQSTLPFMTVAGAPINGEKQMIMLSQPEQVPDHILKQMYGAKPQMMTLYGGRMTADRLREVGLVTRDAIEDLHKQLDRRPADTEELVDPKGLQVPLMTHQRQALAWLTWREKQRPSGGILADDMGLGKTLTMISLIMKQNELNPPSNDKKSSRKSGQGDQDWLSKDKQLEKIDKNIVKSRASLIICPASLIHQWYKEIQNRCKPGMLQNIMLYHGPNRETNVFKLADNDIVLTTYNIVSKEVGENADAKEAEKPVGDQDFFKGKKVKDIPNLSRIAWERVILDEAHNIKNHKCKTSISVCRLRAGCRWALTGTPIQNDLLDMYSLLRFLRCSPFDELQVWKRQVAMNAGTGKARLNTLVKSFLLRRTKDQKGKDGKPLVPLPKKSIILHELKLSAEEKSVYDKVYSQSQSAFKDYLKRHAEKHGEDIVGISSGAGYPSTDRSIQSGKGGGQKNTGGTHILVSLLRLRQCCGHLSLLKDSIEDEVLESEGIELSLEEQMRGLMLNDSGSAKSKDTKAAISQFDISKASSKLKAVMEELIAIKKRSTKGNPLKSVVVSQWTKMLEIAGHHLAKAGIRCCIIQGNILPHKRTETVEEFNNNPDGPTVMLLSLRAGGVGLNLIGGSSLFLFDQHWNPALEEQACDRIYRVGQKNDVVIHKFLCTDTVEEKIAELQRRKTDLANDILSGSNASKRKLTLADLRMLFGV